jgi:hypothetical protein
MAPRRPASPRGCLDHLPQPRCEDAIGGSAHRGCVEPWFVLHPSRPTRPGAASCFGAPRRGARARWHRCRRGRRGRCGRTGARSGARWRRGAGSLPEPCAALRAGSRLQPLARRVVRAVVTHLRFMAGVALARPGPRRSAVRATQDNTGHPFGSFTASLSKSARRSGSG